MIPSSTNNLPLCCAMFSRSMGLGVSCWRLPWLEVPGRRCLIADPCSSVLVYCGLVSLSPTLSLDSVLASRPENPPIPFKRFHSSILHKLVRLRMQFYLRYVGHRQQIVIAPAPASASTPRNRKASQTMASIGRDAATSRQRRLSLAIASQLLIRDPNHTS